MIRTLRFIVLYIYALLHWALSSKSYGPMAVRPGVAVFMLLVKSNKSSSRHGVVAFVLPPGESLDNDYLKNLRGPFGFTSQIDLFGLHLYGLDDWGSPSQEMINDNPELEYLAEAYPRCTIQLAGVRHFFRIFIPPLNNPRNFYLIGKNYQR